jgi:rubredoxin
MGDKMKKMICSNCGYIYDPAKGDPKHGIPPGTLFEELPVNWSCPICAATKDQFNPL